MKTTGGLSSEIQESLNNFKVIIAFNRRDYFRRRFEEANEKIMLLQRRPVFQTVHLHRVRIFCQYRTVNRVLTVGIYLISTGRFSIDYWLVICLIPRTSIILTTIGRIIYGQTSRLPWQDQTEYPIF
jgi:ABC-type multidrug transport system fused ATPase/permease subunit